MIQRKREQFTREIRRQQLDAIFRERRIQLLEPAPFEHYMQGLYSSPQGRHIAECVDRLQNALRLQQWQKIDESFDRLFQQLHQNKQASGYMMAVSPALSRMLKRVFENEQSIGEDQNEWKRLSMKQQAYLVQKFLQLLLIVSYQESREDYLRGLVGSFWLIFTCDIDLYKEAHHRIFDLLLQVIYRMLSSRSRTVFLALKAMGIGREITRIAQFDMDHLSRQNEQDLLNIVSCYSSLENRFKQQDLQKEVNGKTILEMEMREKEVLMALCLSVIDLGHQNSYQPALHAIISILQRHEYLIHNIIRFAVPIAKLIISPFPSIQLKALEIIDELIYHDSGVGLELMRNRFLPDLLYDTLKKHLKQPLSHTHRFVVITSNTLCNLTVIKEKEKSGDPFYKHPIWDLAYENIYMGSPLLPLLPAFEFYFQILPKKYALNVLESYLTGVGTLDQGLLEKRELQGIRRTIARVHTHSLDFWHEDDAAKLDQLIQTNHLSNLMDELMDIEEDRYPQSL